MIFNSRESYGNNKQTIGGRGPETIESLDYISAGSLEPIFIQIYAAVVEITRVLLLLLRIQQESLANAKVARDSLARQKRILT